MGIDKASEICEYSIVPQTENNSIFQYRSSEIRLSIGVLIEISDRLVAALGWSNTAISIACSGQTFNGDLGELRQQASAWDPDDIQVFTLTIVTAVPASPPETTAQTLQEQIVAKQAQIQQLAQPAQRTQRAQAQQEVRQLQVRLAQISEAQSNISFVLNLNTIHQHISFSALPTASSARNQMPRQVDAAIEVISNRFPRAIDSTESIASKAIRLDGEIGQIDERLQRVRQVTAEGIALLPSVQNTLEQAAKARAGAVAAESEAVRLRHDIEQEASRAKELQRELTKGQAELSRFISSAAASAGQLEKHLAETTSKTQSAIDSIASKAETAMQSLAIARKQSSDFDDFIRASRLSAEAEIKRVIEAFQNGALEWDNKFKAIIADAESKRDQIHNLLGIAVGANLSSAFKTRKTELENGKTWWFTGIVAVTVTITGASYIILSNDGGSTTFIWLQRTLILLPLIFLDLFFLGQYKRKMLLADQYAFKATVAASFDYYKDELMRSSGVDSRTADFVAHTVGRLWAEPNNVTELSGPQIRRFTRMLETLGVTVIKEGSAVTKAALHARGISETQLAPLEAPRSSPSTSAQTHGRDTPTSERS